VQVTGGVGGRAERQGRRGFGKAADKFDYAF
jgi:hypothetical protein